MVTRNQLKLSSRKKKKSKNEVVGKRRVRPEVEIEKLRKM
jgi:hypothetical protein